MVVQQFGEKRREGREKREEKEEKREEKEEKREIKKEERRTWTINTRKIGFIRTCN